MTASLPETTAQEDAAAAAALGIEGAEQAQQETTPEGEEGQAPETLEDLPEWAQREIRENRRKLAAARVKERDARKAKASTESTTPTQTDIEAAKAAGREEARAEAGIELTKSAVQAALTGVVPEDQLEDVIDELNISRYVGDDHRPDAEEIRSLRDRWASRMGTRKTTPKVSHGRQGTATEKSNAELFGEVLASQLG